METRERSFLRTLILAMICVLVAGCALHPDAKTPKQVYAAARADYTAVTEVVIVMAGEDKFTGEQQVNILKACDTLDDSFKLARQALFVNDIAKALGILDSIKEVIADLKKEFIDG